MIAEQTLINPKAGGVFPCVQTHTWHGSADHFLQGRFGYCSILIEYDKDGD